MKYTATFFDSNETEHNVHFSCRSDSRIKTLFMKTVTETADYMRKNRIASGDIEYCYDLPNLWRNGCVGFISVANYTIYLSRDDVNAYIAC